MRLMAVVLLVPAVMLGACSGSNGDTADDAAATVAVPSTAEDTEAESTATSVATSEVAVPATASPATEELNESVFSFADNNLCAWVTGAEVAEMVSAVYPWDGTAADAVPEPRASCLWRLTGGDGNGYLSAGDASQWVDFSGNPYDVTAAVRVVEYSEDGPPWIEIGTTVTGHPALSDGVVVRNDGFGQYAFWVPPQEQYLSYSLAVPDVVDLFEENRFFVVADELLHELGWVAASQ